MKTFKQLKEEAVSLEEGMLGFLAGGQRRQAKDIKKRLVDASEKGPEEEAKVRLNIFVEVIKGIARIIKNHPKTAAVGLGVYLADVTIAGQRTAMARTGAEKRGEPVGELPSSISGFLARRMVRSMTDSSFRMVRQIYIPVILLLVAGFGLVAVYKLLRMLATRGPEYIDTMISTRDNKQLAYNLKKDFGVDVYTSDVRVGSPGHGKIGEMA